MIAGSADLTGFILSAAQERRLQLIASVTVNWRSLGGPAPRFDVGDFPLPPREPLQSRASLTHVGLQLRIRVQPEVGHELVGVDGLLTLVQLLRDAGTLQGAEPGEGAATPNPDVQ